MKKFLFLGVTSLVFSFQLDAQETFTSCILLPSKPVNAFVATTVDCGDRKIYKTADQRNTCIKATALFRTNEQLNRAKLGQFVSYATRVPSGVACPESLINSRAQSLAQSLAAPLANTLADSLVETRVATAVEELKNPYFLLEQHQGNGFSYFNGSLATFGHSTITNNSSSLRSGDRVRALTGEGPEYLPPGSDFANLVSSYTKYYSITNDFKICMNKAKYADKFDSFELRSGSATGPLVESTSFNVAEVNFQRFVDNTNYSGCLNLSLFSIKNELPLGSFNVPVLQDGTYYLVMKKNGQSINQSVAFSTFTW